MRDPSLSRFRAVVEGGLTHLESRRQEINDLNVFPVADGDTGDNMALTLRAVLVELDRMSDLGRPIDEIGRDEIVESVARAALLGARGNSGVILSQLIRGAAEVLISRPGELVDPILVGAAMTAAAKKAYDSVRAPAEGTMLTVMREMADRIIAELPHLSAARLAGEADAAAQNALLADVLERALEAGEAAVRRGPELLPVLREAGVVDAGGHAVTIVFAGVVAALRGTDAPEIERFAPAAVPSHPEHDSATFRYCVNYAVTGTGLSASAAIAALEALGDSVLVVGDTATLRVHVHADDPEAAQAIFAGLGAVQQVDVADMHAQVAQREERLGGAAVLQRSGALAVATGRGVVALFASLGVTPLDGGQTLNPSTSELLAGIHDVPAEQVIVLPNSTNVVMAAERAAELSDKDVLVLPTTSVPAGLAAAVALDPALDAEANVAAMAEAVGAVRVGAVARAARNDPAGRFTVGDGVGFVEEELVSWGPPEVALRGVLADLARDAELVTCIAGEGAPLGEAEVAALLDGDDAELEWSEGGQPSYWYLLSAE